VPVFLPIAAAGEVIDETLHDWAVYEVRLPDLPEPTAHVVGCIRYDGTGRVSSPVQHVDAVKRCVETRSGSVYCLAGAPGMNSQAEYVWNRWRKLWNATVLQDRTAQLLAEFTAAEASDA
jgi:hypothetical protein